jgi:hypothetical protein
MGEIRAEFFGRPEGEGWVRIERVYPQVRGTRLKCSCGEWHSFLPGPRDYVEGERTVCVLCPQEHYDTPIRAGRPLEGNTPRWGRPLMWWRCLLGRASGYGWCGRCKRPWNVVRSHETPYRPGQGCFPLCEDCWQILTPDQRLPYYMALVDKWERQGMPPDEERRMMVRTAAEMGL